MEQNLQTQPKDMPENKNILQKEKIRWGLVTAIGFFAAIINSFSFVTVLITVPLGLIALMYNSNFLGYIVFAIFAYGVEISFIVTSAISGIILNWIIKSPNKKLHIALAILFNFIFTSIYYIALIAIKN